MSEAWAGFLFAGLPVARRAVPWDLQLAPAAGWIPVLGDAAATAVPFQRLLCSLSKSCAAASFQCRFLPRTEALVLGSTPWSLLLLFPGASGTVRFRWQRRAGIRLHVENLSCFKDFPACIRACGASHRLREDLWFGQRCLGCQRCLKME